MDSQTLAKDIIKEYVLEIQRLEAQIAELLKSKKELVEETEQLSKRLQRQVYSGLND